MPSLLNRRPLGILAAWCALTMLPDAMRVDRARLLAQQPAAPRDASRIAVRVVPSRDPADNRKVLDTLERYFEGTLRRFDRDQPLDALSLQVCGHVNTDWIARVRERAKLAGDAIPAGTEVTLPPCPYFQHGGRITVGKDDTVTNTAMREIGQAGSGTLERIAKMNDMTVAELDRVPAGKALDVQFRTSPVSLVLKPGFAGKEADVRREVEAAPGALPATLDLTLSLITGDDLDCELGAASDAPPFDVDAVAARLEENATIRPPFQKAVIGVVDTGIDREETRVFFARDVNQAIGATMDRNTEDGFPTTDPDYEDRAHGTHVAGLVLGGLQSERLNALVRDRIHVKIINIVSREARRNDNGELVESFVIPMTNLESAIVFAQKAPQIPILNMSLETLTQFEPLRNAFASGDYLVIAAAGNRKRNIDIDMSFPASFRTDLPRRFLTVAAARHDGTRAPFSNSGRDSVDLAAPGCNVRSILPGNQVGTMTGTSQATPLVAFTAGLLYSDGLTLQQVRNRIRASVRLAPPPLSDDVRTGGLLDIVNAITIHEDLVTVDGETAPRRGKVVALDCVTIEGQCRPLKRVARIATITGEGGVRRTLGWLHNTDGEIITRPAVMPQGTLRFRPRGAAADQDIPFEKVTDILFAIRP